MLFFKPEFVLFFAVLFNLYWFLPKNSVKIQNWLLLVSSYAFYAWIDLKFLALLFVSTHLVYLTAKAYKQSSYPSKKNLLYTGSLVYAIGVLGFFKYFNFFLQSFVDFFNLLSINFSITQMKILIPIGISFYSFRLISYIIEIGREKIEPISDPIVFHNYISFFPTVLSGPIDRANKFLPQLAVKRTFSYALCVLAFRQILWGLFKKMVIADNCAEITANVFDNYTGLPASSLLLGGILYTVQMYADFSGYSDIAIGFGKLLGFEVNKNFNYPFFATNIAEFWRNWHISLTTWLTEYVFTPLTIFFRNLGKLGLILSIVINFAICGLWHGANWTYIVFGILNGLYFIPMILGDKMYKKRKKGATYTFLDFLKMGLVFSMFMLSLLIFRASSMTDFFLQMKHIFSPTLFEMPFIPFNKPLIIQTLIFIVVMFSAEWFTRQHDFPLFKIEQRLPKLARYTVYYLILVAILVFQTKTENFIYVQF